MTEHVRVVKRREALGIGARPAGAGGEAALSSAVSDYNALLASLAASGTAAPAAAPVRIIGRFAHHRALRQKNVAGYSEADLRAILGTHALGAGGKAGGAGDAVALPSAPLVQRAAISVSLKKTKRDKKSKREKKEARAGETSEERAARRAARRERKRLKREAAGKD